MICFSFVLSPYIYNKVYELLLLSLLHMVMLNSLQI